MFKRIHCAAWLAALVAGVLAMVSVARALDVPTLTGRVNDLAQVLDAQAERELEQRLAAYEQQSGHQFALLTIRSLEGDALEPFTMRVVEAWKLGQKQKDDGLLMLVVVDDRRMRIEVGYGLEGDIPDTLAGRIIRNIMAPEFRKGDYAAGINQAFDALMGAASGEAVDVPQAESSEDGGVPVHGMWPLVWIGLFLFLALGKGGRGGLLFLPLLMGGGHHRGGYRGSSGWGGGGGGSFGGGGASGDW